ncbi:MAG: four helix bundle protein [Anaerolineae bacterium]|nr:four helix bundle protein [Anaerolineae bacterium]
MAKGDDIEARMIDFAVRIIRLGNNLPKSRAGNHIAGQLLCSGTAPAAIYAEARGAESSKDFVHKLKLGLKELNESRVWLKIISKSDLLSAEKLHNINQECDELCRVINASIKTARKKLE